MSRIVQIPELEFSPNEFRLKLSKILGEQMPNIGHMMMMAAPTLASVSGPTGDMARMLTTAHNDGQLLFKKYNLALEVMTFSYNLKTACSRHHRCCLLRCAVD